MFLEILARFMGMLPAGVAERVAITLGDFCWWAMPARRATVIGNLQIAQNHGMAVPAGVAAMARQSFRHTAMTLVEFLRGMQHPWADNTVVEGREFIEAALAEKRGVYILVAHQGNWEACGASLSKLIHPAHALVKKVGGPTLNSFVLRLRRANGFRDIERAHKGDGVRTIFKALANGEMVVFVMDQSRPGEPKIPFFGVPAHSNTGLAALWLRRPAPIVPVWTERLSFGRHRLHFQAALDLSEHLPQRDQAVGVHRHRAAGADEILALTRKFNETLEALIQQKPEQYFWMHRRWK